MSTRSWLNGYQEIKNVIHNEIGVTKEEMLEVFRQIAKDEIQKIVSEKRDFIYKSIKEVINEQMTNAIANHKYPKVSGNVLYYGGKNTFQDYVSGVMKEEILSQMRDKFNFRLDIEKSSE
jgi:hypothetical protein